MSLHGAAARALTGAGLHLPLHRGSGFRDERVVLFQRLRLRHQLLCEPTEEGGRGSTLKCVRNITFARVRRMVHPAFMPHARVPVLEARRSAHMARAQGFSEMLETGASWHTLSDSVDDLVSPMTLSAMRVASAMATSPGTLSAMVATACSGIATEPSSRVAEGEAQAKDRDRTRFGGGRPTRPRPDPIEFVKSKY